MRTPRKNFVTTWIRLEFNKNSKPVCEGQFLSKLVSLIEELAETDEELKKTLRYTYITDEEYHKRLEKQWRASEK